MKLIIFLSLLAGISIVQADIVEELSVKCKKAKNFKDTNECIMDLMKLEEKSNLKDALAFSEVLCEPPIVYCIRSYPIALKISQEAAEQILNQFIKRCDENPVYCEDLARIYEQRHEHK